MSGLDNKDRRKSPRYETDLKVNFYVNFDLKTRLTFRVRDQGNNRFSSEKFFGVSQNVSTEGLCFASAVKLKKGQGLRLEVFVPCSQTPIVMQGMVRWCRDKGPASEGEGNSFLTGVKVLEVNDEPVSGTIFFDQIHQLFWSNVLESVFSSFKELSKAKIERMQEINRQGGDGEEAKSG